MALASSVRIEIAGQEIKDFLEFFIDQKMHDLQQFRVTCRMDTFENQDDSVLNQSKKFIGSTIVIGIETFNQGWKGTSPGFRFKGIIHSVKAVKSDISHEDLIVLHGYSPDCLLNDHAGCRSFENKTLKQIVEAVLKPYPRDILSAKVNPNYSEQIPYCVQFKENTLDFLKRLAVRYGEWMYYDGKELVFGSPGGNSEDLVLGKDLKTLEFSINMKAPGFKYVSYNYMDARTLEAETNKNMGKDQQNEVGKIAHDQSWKRFNQVSVLDYPHLNVNEGKHARNQNDLVSAAASGISAGMSEIEAKGENMKLVPGSRINVKALKTESRGDIDYGEYIINSIQHHCDNLLNYENSFTAFPSSAKVPWYTNPEAVPFSAPQSAIVKDNKDPEKLGRIRVNFFWQDKSQVTPWIRVANIYAANERGFYFIPEIDDEVLVGFEGGDAEKPFIMGSLYNGRNKPHNAWPNQNNSFKGIVTKSNLRLEFDDEKKITTIDTPGGNKIMVSDDQKTILLSDQNNNKVELSPEGISMESPKEIKLKAQSKISIQATSGIEISSSSDVEISGMNINQTADIGFTAKGSASAELSASGNTTVKGALVMIN